MSMTTKLCPGLKFYICDIQVLIRFLKLLTLEFPEHWKKPNNYVASVSTHIFTIGRAHDFRDVLLLLLLQLYIHRNPMCACSRAHPLCSTPHSAWNFLPAASICMLNFCHHSSTVRWHSTPCVHVINH